jgi:hypothetical protein
LILPEILSVVNSRESVFSRILKSDGDYWVPETLVEQSGSGTQIDVKDTSGRIKIYIYIILYTSEDLHDKLFNALPGYCIQPEPVWLRTMQ